MHTQYEKRNRGRLKGRMTCQECNKEFLVYANDDSMAFSAMLDVHLERHRLERSRG